MGLNYEDFRNALLRALDVRLPAPARADAEEQFADLLRTYPVREYPVHLLRLLKELADGAGKAPDPVVADAAYGWAIPVVRQFVLDGLVKIDDLEATFGSLMQRKGGLSPATWRQLALALEAMADRNLAERSLRLLREVPAAERRAALRDDTLRRLEALPA